MYPIGECQKVDIKQGAFYFGISNRERSEGYLEFKPYTSLDIHNRSGGIENLVQVKGSCVMVIFSNDRGENYKLDPKNKLSIIPEGVWHIHSNPFSKKSLTYWHFEGDIRKIIENIKNSNK